MVSPSARNCLIVGASSSVDRVAKANESPFDVQRVRQLAAMLLAGIQATSSFFDARIGFVLDGASSTASTLGDDGQFAACASALSATGPEGILGSV